MTEALEGGRTSAQAVETGPSRRHGSRAAFLTAVGIGLVAGWLELAAMMVERSIDPRISMDSLRTNRHFFWMIPLGDVLLFTTLGLLVALLARVQPEIVRRHAWRLFTGLALLAVLLAVESLHVAASAALACGLGFQFGPWLESRAHRFRRLALVGPPALAAGLAVLACVGYSRVATEERRLQAGRIPALPDAPNLIWIVLDNVRADSMSLYGHDRPTTPNLERLARKAAFFTRARAPAPWTLPSHATMFTGQLSQSLSVGWDRPLDDTFPTMAEHLAANGYATAGFVGNTYYCNTRYGLGRGFDRYEDYYENMTASPFEVIRSTGLGKCVLRALGFSIKVEKGGTGTRKTAEMINRDALSWLSRRPGERPFFVFLNYFDAHGPFIPPDGPDPRFGLSALPRQEQVEVLKRFKKLMDGKIAPDASLRERIVREAADVYRDSYESCIAYLDRQVGLLFDDLDRRGLLKQTLVIVTSDHGEHFMEHGFFGHGLSLYRREVHVPLLIFPPEPLSERRVVSTPVSLRDLAATCVNQLGLGDRSPFPGGSLSRLWENGDALAGTTPSPVVSEVGHQTRLPPIPDVPATLGPVQSLVLNGKVFLHNADGRDELYDLEADPLETRNLIGRTDLEPLVKRFRNMLAKALANPAGPASSVAAGDVNHEGETSRE
jgi:arylsulfatase A-like enzyme